MFIIVSHLSMQRSFLKSWLKRNEFTNSFIHFSESRWGRFLEPRWSSFFIAGVSTCCLKFSFKSLSIGLWSPMVKSLSGLATDVEGCVSYIPDTMRNVGHQMLTAWCERWKVLICHWNNRLMSLAVLYQAGFILFRYIWWDFSLVSWVLYFDGKASQFFQVRILRVLACRYSKLFLQRRFHLRFKEI